MVCLSFASGVYTVFYDSELFLLLYFSLALWVIACFVAIIILIYYFRSRAIKHKKMKFAERLRLYLEKIINENNRIKSITKLKWKRGYQSLWIEITKLV